MALRLLWLSVILSVAAQAQPPDVTFASVASRVDPTYSEGARTAGLQGTVTLAVVVDATGVPRRISLLSGLGMGLNERAAEAVQQWRFAPGRVDGQISALYQTVDVNFSLPDGARWRIRNSWYDLKPGKRMESQAPALTDYAAPDPSTCPGRGELVRVRFEIDAEGRVSKIKNPSFANTLSKWRFRPALIDGAPKKVQAMFELDCSAPVPRSANEAEPGKAEILPTLVERIEPEYSTAARNAKIRGELWLSMIVDKDGRAAEIAVTRPLGYGLEERAMEAVKAWRFRPGQTQGKIVDSVATVAVTFRLI